MINQHRKTGEHPLPITTKSTNPRPHGTSDTSNSWVLKGNKKKYQPVQKTEQKTKSEPPTLYHPRWDNRSQYKKSDVETETRKTKNEINQIHGKAGGGNAWRREGKRRIKAGRPHSHPTTKPSISQAKALEPHHVQCRDRDSQDTSKLQPLPRDNKTKFYLPRFNITDKASKVQSFIKTTKELFSTLPCTGLREWKERACWKRKGRRQRRKMEEWVAEMEVEVKINKKLLALSTFIVKKAPPYFPND